MRGVKSPLLGKCPSEVTHPILERRATKKRDEEDGTQVLQQSNVRERGQAASSEVPWDAMASSGASSCYREVLAG
jgi:hypothetical protein